VYTNKKTEDMVKNIPRSRLVQRMRREEHRNRGGKETEAVQTLRGPQTSQNL